MIPARAQTRPSGDDARDLRNAESAGRAAAAKMNANPLFNGVFVEVGDMAASEEVIVDHGLNRQLRGVLPSIPAGNIGVFTVVRATLNSVTIVSPYDITQAGFYLF